MESNFVTGVLLPLSLAFIMFGMGLGLTVADFKRVFIFPKAVFIGITLKILFIPIVAFLMLMAIPTDPALAVGFMLLAACPGGATSNLLTKFSKGDVALSITLTAIASAITVATIPLTVNLSLGYFMEGDPVKLDLVETMVKIIGITVIPVAIGMAVRYFAANFTDKAEKPVRLISAVLLVLIIIAAIWKDKDNLSEFALSMGPMTLVLNVVALALGYFVSRLFNLSKEQSTTVAVETGIVNGTLGIMVGATLLKDPSMPIPSAVYSLVMFITIGAVIYLRNRKTAV